MGTVGTSKALLAPVSSECANDSPENASQFTRKCKPSPGNLLLPSMLVNLSSWIISLNTVSSDRSVYFLYVQNFSLASRIDPKKCFPTYAVEVEGSKNLRGSQVLFSLDERNLPCPQTDLSPNLSRERKNPSPNK